jgi:CBS domain-containing protein
MTTAREIMTQPAECAKTTESLTDAARKMRDLDVGALPICGEDDRLHGMITDRDIAVRCVAEGQDPTTTKVEAYAGDKPFTIGADDSIEEALDTMIQHGVRRLPVIDDHRLVGMLSQADIAKHSTDQMTARLVESISMAPAN